MEENMKNTKKLLFAGTLALALSASAVLPTSVQADGEENQAQEQVQESVKLDLQFRVKNNEGKMQDANSYFNNYESIVDINGTPHTLSYHSNLVRYEAKRGTRLNFKYKKSGEVGAKHVAEGSFDVPEVGYEDYDDINIILNPVDGKENETEEKIEEDKKEEKPQKPEEKPEENQEKPQVDEKEDKIEEEKPQVDKNEEKEDAPSVEEEKKDETTDEKVEDKNEEAGKSEDKKENEEDVKPEDKNEESTEQKDKPKNEEENKKPQDEKPSEDLEEKGYKTKKEAEKAAKK